MKKHVMLWALVVAASLLMVRGGIYSQGDASSPCDRAGNTQLPSLLKKGSIGGLTWWGNSRADESICSWSTSCLRATGKRPVKAAPSESRDVEEVEREYWIKLTEWSCMYSALSAMDGDTKTAWSEGKKDEGIGEVLIVKVDTAKPVRIWGGLGASESFYKANNRPRTIRVWVLQAREARKEIGQYDLGIVYGDITVLGSNEIVLKDLNGWQPLPLPPHKRIPFRNTGDKGETAVKDADSTFVAVEILSVYKGTKYNDTCISEIGNAGR